MVVEWLMSLATGFVGWLTDTFGSWDLPAFVTSSRSGLVTVMQSFTGLGVWVDWTVLGLCVAAVIGSVGLAVGVKGLRWFVGLWPTMGGGS